MNNNYRIIRTIFENVFQRVLECKDIETGQVFYSNVITNSRVINLIDIEELKKISSNILECYKSEDRIYIYTKPLDEECRNIREFVKSKLTLKQQYLISKKIIGLSSDIFDMTDVVQQKILDIDRIYIDEGERLIVDCNLIFTQEFDIPDNETMKRMGNILHYVFSGSEIVDYNISELVPPDMLKLIVRSLTREYSHPKDAMKELITSPLYSMIFSGGSESREKKLERVSVMDRLDVNKLKPEGTEERGGKETINLYLNGTGDDSDEDDEQGNLFGRIMRSDVKKAAVSVIAVVIVLLAGKFAVGAFEDTEEVSSKSPAGSSKQTTAEQKTETTEPSKETAVTSEGDSTGKYLNDELLKKIGYSGNKAGIDSDIFVEGKSSLVVKNDSEDKIKSLFAALDFSDESTSYMLKQQIGISAKAKAEKDVTAQIVLEAVKGGIVSANFHSTVKLYDDMWSQITVPINVTSADSLNVYIEYSGQNEVWIDSILIDAIK
jgi:FlaG/FlaF family flagellin (archaellin)